SIHTALEKTHTHTHVHTHTLTLLFRGCDPTAFIIKAFLLQRGQDLSLSLSLSVSLTHTHTHTHTHTQHTFLLLLSVSCVVCMNNKCCYLIVDMTLLLCPHGVMLFLSS